MIIEVKYDIGDNIEFIERCGHEVYGPCPCCGKKGYIVGEDGEEYDCPVCKGAKTICEGTIKTEEKKTGTIKSFRVKYDSDMECYEKPWIYYNIPQSTYNIAQEDVIRKIEE